MKIEEIKTAKLHIPRTNAEIHREMLYGDSYDGCRGIIKPLDGILKGDGYLQKFHTVQ